MKIDTFRRALSYAIVLLPFFFLLSCKKNNDGSGSGGSEYYMKFKIDGTQVEYRGQAECNFNKVTASSHAASFAGLKETLVAGKNNMSLILGTDGENKTGVTYTCYTTTSAGAEKAKVLNIVYIDDAGKTYMSWMEEFSAAIPPGTKTEAQLIVTEASAAALKGNFSGTLYNNDFTKALSITNGEFYLRRID